MGLGGNKKQEFSDLGPNPDPYSVSGMSMPLVLDLRVRPAQKLVDHLPTLCPYCGERVLMPLEAAWLLQGAAVAARLLLSSWEVWQLWIGLMAIS